MEMVKKRISNVEGMYSINFIKRLSAAIPSFVILRFDIRYSAVRCLIQAIEVSSLYIKKPCHFGVVSYEADLRPDNCSTYSINNPHSHFPSSSSLFRIEGVAQGVAD